MVYYKSKQIKMKKLLLLSILLVSFVLMFKGFIGEGILILILLIPCWLLIQWFFEGYNESPQERIDYSELYYSNYQKSLRNKDGNGMLNLNKEENIVFNPFQNKNFLKDSFGLSPVFIKELSQEDNFFINNSEEPVSSGLPYCVGLYREINEDGDQLIDIIPNKEAERPDAIMNSPEEIKKKVSAMLSVLDERERVIIERYYGLTGVESNLEDLGEEYGCTKERIRQLRDKAIKKLRNESFGLLNYL